VKLLLFDIDQTLIYTGGAGIRALNRVFRNLGVENAMDGILPYGKTDPGIIGEIFAAIHWQGTAGVADIVNEYLTFLREEVEASTAYSVLPGIVAILQELRQRPDVLMGLATGNVEAGARIKLERGDLNQYFQFGGFGSDFENRTALVRHAAELGVRRSGQAISPDDTVVIGDTPRDIDAGREAGFRTVGVATGKYTQAELDAAGATTVMSDFERDRTQFLRVTRIA
jgi:phosphoglycolate phosphatase-like HAD superfamily hydrolase